MYDLKNRKNVSIGGTGIEDPSRVEMWLCSIHFICVNKILDDGMKSESLDWSAILVESIYRHKDLIVDCAETILDNKKRWFQWSWHSPPRIDALILARSKSKLSFLLKRMAGMVFRDLDRLLFLLFFSKTVSSRITLGFPSVINHFCLIGVKILSSVSDQREIKQRWRYLVWMTITIKRYHLN